MNQATTNSITPKTPFSARYLTVLFVPLGPLFYWALNGYEFNLWIAILVVALMHAVVPLLDALIPAKDDPGSATGVIEPVGKTHVGNQAIPVLCALFWLGALVWGAWVGQYTHGPAWIGLSVALGTVGGIAAINIGHELIHRQHRAKRELGALVLASTCYSAFRVEHVRGHHLRVATPADSATARYGESVYTFVPRSILGTLSHSWILEVDRMKRLGKPVWSLSNEVWRGNLISILIAGFLGVCFGLQAIGLILLVSVIAVFELEIVNYIEHYGLLRRQDENGKFEPVTAMHTWDANTPLVNAFLLNLQRHADHHANGDLDYIHLRSIPESPQLPAGYGAMVLAAMAPPLWRKLMHPRLAQLTQTTQQR